MMREARLWSRAIISFNWFSALRNAVAARHDQKLAGRPLQRNGEAGRGPFTDARHHAEQRRLAVAISDAGPRELMQAAADVRCFTVLERKEVADRNLIAVRQSGPDRLRMSPPGSTLTRRTA